MEQFVLIKKAEKEPNDTPIVLIHGSWGSSMMWSGYTSFLVSKGWNVYAPDLRGHGKSGGSVSGATMIDYVSDVRKTVEENQLQNPIIIGHSMGGLVALMYAAEHGAKAVVVIDPSQSKEVQGKGEEKEYPLEYSAMDAGMPTDLMEVMKTLPDVSQETMMKMKEMLGMESGVARSERKLGISIPKEKLSMPVLFVGGELGESLPFGIGIEKTTAMAEYYGKDILEIKGATHPGILIGNHSLESAEKIAEWLKNK